LRAERTLRRLQTTLLLTTPVPGLSQKETLSQIYLYLLESWFTNFLRLPLAGRQALYLT
jgi:hypothetical protein